MSRPGLISIINHDYFYSIECEIAKFCSLTYLVDSWDIHNFDTPRLLMIRAEMGLNQNKIIKNHPSEL